jgi:hypothetical protein
MMWRAISVWPYPQMFRAMNLTKQDIKDTGGSPEELVAASVLKSTLALDALGETVRDTLQGGGLYDDWGTDKEQGGEEEGTDIGGAAGGRHANRKRRQPLKVGAVEHVLHGAVRIADPKVVDGRGDEAWQGGYCVQAQQRHMELELSSV